MSEYPGLSRRELQLLAAGWDAAVKALKDEDGSPLVVAENHNPYREAMGDA